MNERDIPSVPITTLAGVASLTDRKYTIIYIILLPNNFGGISLHIMALGVLWFCNCVIATNSLFHSTVQIN